MSAVAIERRTIPTMSAETSAVIRLLRGLEPGAVLTYEAISKEIGCDVRTRRHVLSSARDRVLKDDAIHTAIVAKVGVKRIGSAEAGRGLEHHVKRARNAARRGRTVASRLNIPEIPQEERATVVARASLLELIDYAGTAKAQTKMIAATSAQPEEKGLPLRRMLAALKE